jgi:hypothetical protein
MMYLLVDFLVLPSLLSLLIVALDQIFADMAYMILSPSQFISPTRIFRLTI